MSREKNTYYFSHDANAHEDPRIISLMVKFGAEGYGWWWILVEVMMQQGYELDMNDPTMKPMLFRLCFAKDEEKFDEFLEYCLELKLLKDDDGKLISPSLLKRVERLEEIRGKRRDAANVRWSKKPKDKNEKKETPPKTDITKTKKVLTDPKLWAEFKEELTKHDKIKVVPKDVLESERDKCVNYIDYKKKAYKDHKAFFRNWLMKVIEDKNGFKDKGRGMVH